MKNVKVAVIGYGGIARAHSAGYNALKAEGEPIRLVAVCDIDPDQLARKVAINTGADKSRLPADIRTYTSVDALIANEDFDMADICLPSYLHSEYAIKLLRAGKHVLSEKPMALNVRQCDAMIEAAREAGRKLMIGQCLRFNACYLYLKDCVDSGRYGKLRHLFMDRLSAQPRWGFEHWFEQTEKSGGCILDMHIHDVDMVRFLLGEPEAVSTVALDRDVRWQIENTRMYYEGKLVVINASWDEAASCKFKASYRARFERATVCYDGGTVTVYPDEGEPFAPALTHQSHHITQEIRAFLHELLEGRLVSDANPPESARESVRVIEKLRESAARGGAIIKL